MLSHGFSHAQLRQTGWVAILFVLVIISQTGCSAEPVTPTTAPTLPPTATTSPSETPEPTVTQPPTATVAPTVTPDMEATQQVQETATYLAGFDMARLELEKLALNPEEGRLAYFNPEQIALTISDDSLYKPEIILKENLTDFVIQTKVQWTTERGFSGCGIVFHAGEDMDTRQLYMYNIVRLPSVPHWFVWVIKGAYTDWEPVPMTASTAIKDQQNDLNELTLMVQGDQIYPYINGELQKAIYNNLPMDGQIGLNAWTDTGSTTCAFTDTWIWALK